MDSVQTSLIDVNLYDLNWHVIKNKILSKKNLHKSDVSFLAYLIKQLGKLDLYFLRSQL